MMCCFFTHATFRQLLLVMKHEHQWELWPVPIRYNKHSGVCIRTSVKVVSAQSLYTEFV